MKCFHTRSFRRMLSAAPCLVIALAGCASDGQAVLSSSEQPLALLPQNAASTLHYGSPLQCLITLQAEGTVAAKAGQWQGETKAGSRTGIDTALSIGAESTSGRYAVVHSNGGWCDNALAGTLQVVANGNGVSVSITLNDSSGTALGGGNLSAVD